MPGNPIPPLIRFLVLAAALLAAALIVARPSVPVVEASVARQPAKQTQVGEGPNKAALAVKYADGIVETVCVSFPEDEIGGGDLLERSGLELGMSAEGALCSIEGEGCTSDDCFCQCRTFDNCQYWAFYQWENGGWVYSQFGVMAQTVVVTDGSMHGWSWGSGDDTSGAPAPEATFEQVCTAAAGDATATPTATATSTVTATSTATFTPATQPAIPTAAPTVSFTAAAGVLEAKQCTTLSWSTVDAASVTLDGTMVAFAGTQQVCPEASQIYTIVAANAAGQTMRQISLQVRAPSTASPTLAAVLTQQPGVTPRPVLPTPFQRPIITQAPQPLPAVTAQQPALFTTPQVAPTLMAQDVLAGAAPLAPTAEVVAPLPTPTLFATPTRYTFSLPSTETPRPRRVLAADAPTPTPLLMARVAGGSGQAPGDETGGSALPAATGRQRLVQSRSFTPELLPQYAAYIATLVALLVMGWFTLRRRGRSSDRVTVPVQDGEPVGKE